MCFVDGLLHRTQLRVGGSLRFGTVQKRSRMHFQRWFVRVYMCPGVHGHYMFRRHWGMFNCRTLCTRTMRQHARIICVSIIITCYCSRKFCFYLVFVLKYCVMILTVHTHVSRAYKLYSKLQRKSLRFCKCVLL